MIQIRKPTIHEAWLELLNRLARYDFRVVSPQGHSCRELLGVSLRVEDLRANILVHPRRNLNYRFMVAEWLWIALGRNDVATVARYNPEIAQFSDDGLTFTGAYGPRLS